MATNASRAPRAPIMARVADNTACHSDPTTHSTELCHMKKAQLLEIARELGLTDIKPTIRKPELIELIEGAEA